MSTSSTMNELRQLTRIFLKRHFLPQWFVFSQDAGAVYTSFLLAYLLRFNFTLSAFTINIALEHGLVVLGVYMLYSLMFKPYAGIIRHTTVRDVFNVFIANSASVSTLILISILGRLF